MSLSSWEAWLEIKKMVNSYSTLSAALLAGACLVCYTLCDFYIPQILKTLDMVMTVTYNIQRALLIKPLRALR